MLADSFNSMAGSLQNLVEAERSNAQQMEQTVSEYMAFVEQVAEGDLAASLDVEQAQQAELARLGHNLNVMVARLASMAVQVRDASTSVQETAAEIQVTATEQASSSTEQDAAVTQTLAMAEAMADSVRQTAESVRAVAEAARQSVEVSQMGQAAVANTIDGMRRILERSNGITETVQALAERTQQIGEVIETVNEIADQSKLLALNASIEASRAGEQGRGFAVVAMEVRQLAEQSRQATARVSAILGEIQQTTEAAVKASAEGSSGAEDGMTLVGTAGEAIEQLAGVIQQAALEADTIAEHMREQSNRMEQLSSAMAAIKQASVQTAASTTQSDRSARNLNKTASEMQNAVSRYNLAT
ncbi:chemotaxis protein [bacterium]|nr:chemotaxis protein [bacterium]